MPPDGFERATQHAITYDRPAVNFFEGALLGDGALGAVVCTRPDAVVVHFGHNSVWDIRLSEANREEIGTFQDVFERVKAIPDSLDCLTDDAWYAEYCKMARENYSKPYPRPFPCGTLILGYDRREVETLGHALNIATGVCTVDLLVKGAPLHLVIFTDMNSDRLWIQSVDASGDPAPSPFDRVKLIPDADTPKDLPEYTTHVAAEERTLSFRQTLCAREPAGEAGSAPDPQDRAFRLSVRLSGALDSTQRLGVNGLWRDMDTLERRITPGPVGVIVAQLEQGLASEISESAPLNLIDPTATAFAEVADQSLHSWREYWSCSAVSIADDALEQTWYRNLYFLNCSVRAGVTCPGLFANWSYGKIGTPWHGDYHMNYNTQQPFWVTFSSNHLDKHLPYVDMVHHLLPSSRAWAKDYYGMRGAFFPHSAYPVDMTMNPYPVPTWGWEAFETPWTVQSLWWHYRYSQDLDFLRERAFAPIKDAALFMVDYMSRPDAHGPQWGDDRYHIFPTVAPELYGLMPGFDRNADGLADLTLTKFVFKAFEEACRVLGYEADEAEALQQIQKILKHYPDYPTAKTETGMTYVSIRGEKPGIVYNVPATTLTVFPGEEHGLHSDESDYALALNSYRYQQNEGGNELVFLNLQAARLGVLDLDRFKRQVHYCALPNGACTDKVLQSKGRYSDSTRFDWMAPHGIWFENFALPVVINECLMQSYTGIIRLFPNWPESLDAAFTTLRAVGAFLVSCERRQGKYTFLSIASEKGGRCRLYTPWTENDVRVICKGETVTSSVDDNVISFETNAGSEYRISHVRTT